jgi:hypothetical protein
MRCQLVIQAAPFAIFEGWVSRHTESYGENLNPISAENTCIASTGGVALLRHIIDTLETGKKSSRAPTFRKSRSVGRPRLQWASVGGANPPVCTTQERTPARNGRIGFGVRLGQYLIGWCLSR